jgi:DNA-binding NtrC family response regulator
MPNPVEPNTDDFLDKHLPGDSKAVTDLRRGIFRHNLWHRQASGRVHCTLITGETGTGKYRLSKLLVQHAAWSRQGGGDIPAPEALSQAAANLARVLLTAIPDTLAEAILFGHTKGAFTGADRDRVGVFGDDEIENILLDEVGDASPALQGKLLEVIEDRTFHKLGTKPSEVLKTDARILLATRADLHRLVREGKFREDLYWRIMPFRLHLPAVRDRADEIPVLMTRMLAEHIRGLNMGALGLPGTPALQPADREFAQAYSWPGNLRQMSDALLAWLVAGTRASLREIVESGPQGFIGDSGPTVGEIVQTRLEDIVAKRRDPYAKLGECWKEIEREVKEALYRCCVEKGLFDGEQLKFMFNDQKIENIRSALSTCRPSTQENI